MYDVQLKELPKNLINKIVNIYIDDITERGFIWIKKCRGLLIYVLIEDGYGNISSTKAKCKNEYTIQEPYMFKINNKKIYVGNDEDINCEVNTIWNNNKKQSTNPLESLRLKYIPRGTYIGEKNWTKRLDKLEAKANSLKKRKEISNYLRKNDEVLVSFKDKVFVFGVNYCVLVSREGNQSKELFELVAHKDSITSSLAKCKMEYQMPDWVLELIQQYDLR